MESLASPRDHDTGQNARTTFDPRDAAVFESLLRRLARSMCASLYPESDLDRADTLFLRKHEPTISATNLPYTELYPALVTEGVGPLASALRTWATVYEAARQGDDERELQITEQDWNLLWRTERGFRAAMSAETDEPKAMTFAFSVLKEMLSSVAVPREETGPYSLAVASGKSQLLQTPPLALTGV